jgi:hypothetical protein
MPVCIVFAIADRDCTNESKLDGGWLGMSNYGDMHMIFITTLFLVHCFNSTILPVLFRFGRPCNARINGAEFIVVFEEEKELRAHGPNCSFRRSISQQKQPRKAILGGRRNLQQ